MEEGETIKMKVKKEKICPPGKVLNPITNRCNKTKQDELNKEETIKIKVNPDESKKKTKNKKTKKARKESMSGEELPINLEQVIQKLKSLTEGDEYKQFLSKLELFNRQSLDEIKSKTKVAEFASLYPHIDDPLFNVKIAQKKEFHDLKTDDKVHDVTEHGDELCNQVDFELLPHQHFVRNFLSFHTPYNSLLLFHGLGTGKTCSGISVCEEMRDYMKQMGINKRIIIIAPPNILDNFRLQLFDERKLKLINGYWNLDACTGNKFIKEINPMNMRGLSKQQIIKQIKNIINSYYAFFGPDKFANYVERILSQFKETTDPEVKARREIAALKREFSNRLILIDEVHNIRSEDSDSKKVARYLFPVIKNADNLKLLLLSATPMFNSHDEIIWLVNLMNMNDGRPEITIGDVFDKSGEFKKDADGNEVGKELLIRKATGYVSYLRGENPYTFPFRIYMKNKDINPPSKQMNDAEIADEAQIKHIELCTTPLDEYQTAAYKHIIDDLRRNKPEHFNSDVGGMGYSILSNPIQALNMTYPADLEDEPDALVGKRGMAATMKFDKETKRKFAYRDAVLSKYGRIFSPNEIGKYSAKIKFIIDRILKSEGIILIYSQYIEGGCVPLALALEEAGITRYGDDNNNLFSKAPTKSIDAISLKDSAVENPAKYIMITGDGDFSPNNSAEVKAVTTSDNINGEKVKVVIISSAGSEGIDFKYIRQVHILDPWFNINRIEQIIGRGVRFCSHKELPIEKRNVEIYLHASTFDDNTVETADRYVYRLAEQKAIKIGRVARVLKETAVDCNLNKSGYSEERMKQTISISMSSMKGTNMNYKVGDKTFSTMCDYMSDCDYKCSPEATISDADANMDTYSESFIQHNNDIIINKIRAIYKDGYIFTKSYIIGVLTKYKPYPDMQMNSALDKMVNDKSVYIYDQFKRRGNLANVKEYYFFQPIELDDIKISLYDRSHPIDGKFPEIKVKLLEEIVDDDKATFNISNYIRELKAHYVDSTKEHEYTAVTKEVDWYKSAGNARARLDEIIADEADFNRIVVEHMIDTTEFNERIKLYEYMLNPANSTKTDINKRLHEVIKDRVISLGGKKFVLLIEIDVLKTFVIINDNDTVKLEEAKPRDNERVKEYVMDKIKEMKFNGILGFNVYFNKKYLVFKTRDMAQTRNSGARCDQKTKSGIETEISELLKSAGVDESLAPHSETKKGIAKTKKIQNAKELCADLEILHRYFDMKKKNGVKWYLTSEEYMLNQQNN